MTLSDNAVVPNRIDRRSASAVVGLALVALADALFYQQPLGVNAFVYAMAVTAGILFSVPRPATAKVLLLCAVSLIASAPLLEAPSFLGCLNSACGLALVALAQSKLVPQRLAGLPPVLYRFALAAPMRLVRDWHRHFAKGASRHTTAKIIPGLVIWLVPGLFALIFVGLFALANPVIERALSAIDLAAVLRFCNPWRIAFWLLAAAAVWPLLRPRLKRRSKPSPRAEAAGKAIEGLLLGEATVPRSLLVFNALFAVQTLLDLLYLWGGAELPAGMTHAQYAHRGAYPLIITALLAAGFVLVVMRSDGPGESNAAVRGLVHAWISQNILLCISSILRLDLYVEVYSLTELRVAAGIWMALVAVGLALILLRILLRRTNEWLIATNLTALAATLYACALVDIPALVARFNVVHSRELTGTGIPLDIDYLLTLGPSAIPALDTFIAALASGAAKSDYRARYSRAGLAADFLESASGWRGWNYRGQRLHDYLTGHINVATPGEADKNYREQF
ncbi:DUF4173 domain-containing protein [Sinorhizobium sp. BJ1]|uniref:DUF4153 domain-containing protein n=1 Tax=Sinorhizobium sp. BJ1 TaxID=2035455 RepID=UPI000BE80053|nr:DUF4173 domain-containing protein [Sinorhizobium sp. BJ1]PDT80158.1 hypothetical protein CO676_29420 [Sinorhizobium sp. BJ1]